ncbi:MAG: hypothetical protein AAF985_12805 [Bacteroidota bacterium]
MDYQSTLDKYIESYKSILLAKKHLVNLKTRLEQEKDLLQELRTVLDKEYEDLDQLERVSTKSLFHRILRNKKEQYELEKQEYLHAMLRVKECKKTIELLAFEAQVLEEKVSRERVVLQKLNHLLAHREQDIDQRYIKIKDQLMSIYRQVDRKIAYKKELQQALIVALKAQELLKKMIDLIKKAKSTEIWGINSFEKAKELKVKNSYIDQAQEQAYKIKPILQALEDELQDVYEFNAIKRFNKIEEFRHFNDIYYDRLISDWIVQNKIISALNYLKGSRDSVSRIVDSLKIQLKSTEHTIEYLRRRQEEIIIEH